VRKVETIGSIIEYVLDNIWDIFSFLFIVWAGSKLLVVKINHKKKLESFAKKTGNRPVAIVIGIGRDPVAAVETFLQQNNCNIPVLNWVYDSYLETRDYPLAMQEINKLRKRASGLGATEALVFFAGPVEIATFVGTSFANWVPVKVYKYENGTYKMTLVLDTELAKAEKLSDAFANKLLG
jgi:hypothetical protein